jgi:hypothetical protein
MSGKGAIMTAKSWAEVETKVMEKSCENCLNAKCNGQICGLNLSDDDSCDLKYWKPDYPTLEQENAELTQALERACKVVALNRAHECPVESDCWSAHDCLCGDEVCIKRLMKYFKEATQ